MHLLTGPTVQMGPRNDDGCLAILYVESVILPECPNEPQTKVTFAYQFIFPTDPQGYFFNHLMGEARVKFKEVRMAYPLGNNNLTFLIFSYFLTDELENPASFLASVKRKLQAVLRTADEKTRFDYEEEDAQ